MRPIRKEVFLAVIIFFLAMGPCSCGEMQEQNLERLEKTNQATMISTNKLLECYRLREIVPGLFDITFAADKVEQNGINRWTEYNSRLSNEGRSVDYYKDFIYDVLYQGIKEAQAKYPQARIKQAEKVYGYPNAERLLVIFELPPEH